MPGADAVLGGEVFPPAQRFQNRRRCGYLADALTSFQLWHQFFLAQNSPHLLLLNIQASHPGFGGGIGSQEQLISGGLLGLLGFLTDLIWLGL